MITKEIYLRYMKWGVLITLLLITTLSFSQQKQHYILHSSNPNVDLTVYTIAVDNWAGLDAFRFYDERRVISFFGTNGDEGVTIELFSAIELLKILGKQVPPHTIMSSAIDYEAVFYLTPDKQSVTTKIEKN